MLDWSYTWGPLHDFNLYSLVACKLSAGTDNFDVLKIPNKEEQSEHGPNS